MASSMLPCIFQNHRSLKTGRREKADCPDCGKLMTRFRRHCPVVVFNKRLSAMVFCGLSMTEFTQYLFFGFHVYPLGRTVIDNHIANNINDSWIHQSFFIILFLLLFGGLLLGLLRAALLCLALGGSAFLLFLLLAIGGFLLGHAFWRVHSIKVCDFLLSVNLGGATAVRLMGVRHV
jgi:hypothetical protein